MNKYFQFSKAAAQANTSIQICSSKKVSLCYVILRQHCELMLMLIWLYFIVMLVGYSATILALFWDLPSFPPAYVE